MSYVLYGSKTSPFVRRIRMQMEGIPYDFKEMNIFEGQDAIELNKINPINQIPVLKDGESVIWDSRQIFNYLNTRHRFQNMDWQDENTLTAIDGMMQAGVNILMLKRSGIDVKEPYMYIVRQKDRIESVLDYLKPFITHHALNTWDFHTMSLYCFLDWAKFREIASFDHRHECQALVEKYRNQAIVQQTEIPRG